MLIVNPYSGRGLSKNALGAVVSQLGRAGYMVAVYMAGDYTTEELAYQFSKHHEFCVSMGGDGTLSSVVSGLLRSGAVSPAIGHIPSGTANDVAATFNLSKDPGTAAQAIIDGVPTPLDIGIFTGGNAPDDVQRFFTYIAAFGAFTEISYSTPPGAKRTLGHFAYVLSGLSGMSSIAARHMVIELDGNVIEGDYIFGGVINSTSVAGLVKLDPEYVDLSDGLFEVILVKQPLSLVDFVDILTSITNRSYSGDNVQLFHAKNVKFTFDTDVAWTIDGENGGAYSAVEIKNHHEAIRIIV